MAEVKWIKIVTDIFDNRKIKQIEVLPDADSILVIWFKLICLAGSINDGGRVYFMETVPYTDEMLATQFRRPLNTVRMALDVFRQFGMIEIIDDFICLPSWEKYQSTDKLEKIKEQNRLRQKKWYDNQKALPNVRPNVSITQPNATDIDIEEEGDIERDRDIKSVMADEPPTPSRNNYQSIQSLYNTICRSLPRCTSLSDARKKAIAARMNSGYTEDDFKRLFEKAESSSFLKGGNPRNWTANFDWLIKDANMAKVLDGNYDNKGSTSGGRREEPPEWMVKYIKPKTAKDDPDIKARAEQLQRDLNGR